MAPITSSYGDHASQYMRVTVPASPPPSGAPVAVLVRPPHTQAPTIRCRPPSELERPSFHQVHGGYWTQKWTVDNTSLPSVVPSLLEAGMAVVEVEYRRRDDEGGGYPGTNLDVKVCASQSCGTYNVLDNLSGLSVCGDLHPASSNLCVDARRRRSSRWCACATTTVCRSTSAT